MISARVDPRSRDVVNVTVILLDHVEKWPLAKQRMKRKVWKPTRLNVLNENRQSFRAKTQLCVPLVIPRCAQCEHRRFADEIVHAGWTRTRAEHCLVWCGLRERAPSGIERDTAKPHRRRCVTQKTKDCIVVDNLGQVSAEIKERKKFEFPKIWSRFASRSFAIADAEIA